MTPSSFAHSTRAPRRDDTRELLGLIADDTRSQLHRRLVLAAILRCPLVLPRQSREQSATLVGDSISILRSTLGCAKRAIRWFRKHRYDQCLRELDHIDRLQQALSTIDRLTALAVISSLNEGRRHGRRD